LPRGTSIGFELMDNQGFGVTQFQERLNYQRGLQGELTRTIESLAAVESARVHLAIPNSTGFLRNQNQASASVMLRLYPGRYLNSSQTAGIVHLVSSSLERLRPEDVAVIDQDGTLLSQKTDIAGTPDASQIAYLHNVEARLSQRIVELLEPVVGRGNVRAQVNALIDFTETQSTDETYRPNQGNQAAAVRSQQIRAQNGGAGAAANGIPGALTNQPPDPATAPVNGAAQNPQAAANQDGNGGASGNQESVVNYEVDKSIRVTRNGSGTIQRLSAAVVVNHRRAVDDAGVVTFTPLTPQELESMNALVRQAIGFADARGDTINIMNSQFSEETVVDVEPPPIWKDSQVTSLVLSVLKHLGLILLGLLTILMVIRPAIRNMAPPSPEPLPPPKPGSTINEAVEDDLELPTPTAAAVVSYEPEEILKIARQSPAAVAHVVKAWVTDPEEQAS
ncbi:MAG: flagellar basal-body MS-ring/collar protein FliF, partial [Burkholderiaceae bacterium]